MLKKILGLLGWLGVILVFIAVSLRWLPLGLPEWQARSSTFAMAGLVCTLLYIGVVAVQGAIDHKTENYQWDD